MPKAKLPAKSFKWTSDLAYIVGLLVTDGCLSNDGRHIIMRSSDIDLLSTFKKCLKLGNKIGKTNNGKIISHRVQFGNVQFYRWLLTIGLTPAKSHTIGVIKIPDKFFKDFLRGHLDGDGSIIVYKDLNNKYRGRTYSNNRLYVRFISASKTHILWLRQKIKKLASVDGALVVSKPILENRAPIWEIKLAKKESLKILKWVYYKSDLPSLKRKKIKATKAIEMIAKEKRRTYTRI
ncbi:MAG: hypothetical protein WC657_01795 [Candidatus Paceibacterota bacterium]|jgi:hypothetical protein